MTTIETHADASLGAHRVSARPAFLGAVADWLTSTDHKKIGRLFIGFSLVNVLAYAVLAVFLGLERISSTSYSIVDGDAVLQLFNAYRFGLVFEIIAPLLIGVAIAIVPLQVGARSLAYPRLAALGLWSWLFGATFVIISLIGNGGPGGGSSDMVDLYLLSLALVAFGFAAASVSIVVTVLTSRAPGMTLDRVPPFSWAALVGGVAAVLSLPVLVGSLVYLYVDHTYGRVAFGGNTGVASHIGWALSQPMVAVFAIAAVGVLAEVAPVNARVRQPLRGGMLVGLALMSVSALGAVTQTTHGVTWTDTSTSDKVKELIPFAIFNLLPVLGVLIVLGLSVLAMSQGRAKPTPSFVFAFLGTSMVLVGMLANAVQLIGPAGLSGTVFEEGATLYVVYGSVMCALGAVSHWLPKWNGRTLDAAPSFGLALVALCGTVLSSLSYVISGFADQPASAVANFPDGDIFKLWNVLHTAGHVVMAFAVLGFIALVLRGGSAAGDDPWDGQTLEWSVSSPAPENNFADLAFVGSAEPLLDVKSAQNGTSK